MIPSLIPETLIALRFLVKTGYYHHVLQATTPTPTTDQTGTMASMATGAHTRQRSLTKVMVVVVPTGSVVAVIVFCCYLWKRRTTSSKCFLAITDQLYPEFCLS